MDIVPGILTKEYSVLHEQYTAVKQDVPWVHIDVIDNTLVIAGATVLLSDIPNSEFDAARVSVHLMVEKPILYLDECARLGVARMVVHYEAIRDDMEVVNAIKAAGMNVGVAINPGTTASYLEDLLPDVDSVLLMTVEPGKQGQQIMMDVLSKVQEIRVVTPDMIIGIDGGVKLENIELLSQYALDYVVVGSGLWLADDIGKQLQVFKEKLART